MKTNIATKIKEYKARGIKLTHQRLAILEYLDGNTSHPSAENIYKAVKRKFPMMSFATVYKTLETLRQKGDIIELTIDPLRRRYDPDIKPHHHLICIKCKKIADIEADLPIVIPDEAKKEGFEVTGNQVEFYGICSNCKSKENHNH
ncbi:MAG: transcriptional repressor [Nitrospirae bacterium]|nr:transcriptional repressor [Nitrospirota bacterium]